MSLIQPLGAILILWGAWLMLIGVRNWWTLGVLVAGTVLLGVWLFHIQIPRMSICSAPLQLSSQEIPACLRME